jgi:hypothetical protein
MKSFARVLRIIFIIIEVISGLVLLAGLLFRSLHLEGAQAMIMLGCFCFTCVYILTVLTPYYRQLVSSDEVFTQKPMLAFRRLLYLVLSLLVVTTLFYTLNFMGKEQLSIIILPLTILMIILAVVLIAKNRERRKVFQGALIRIILFLILFAVLAFTAQPTTSQL